MLAAYAGNCSFYLKAAASALATSESDQLFVIESPPQLIENFCSDRNFKVMGEQGKELLAICSVPVLGTESCPGVATCESTSLTV